MRASGCYYRRVLVGGAAEEHARPTSVEAAPKLSFSARPPTTLEAFDGVRAVLVAQVGEKVLGKEYGFAPKDPLFWLKIGDENDSAIWRSDGTGSIKKDAFSPAVWGDASIDLPLKSVPQKTMTFGLDAKVVSLNLYQPTKSFDIKGQWQVDKSQLKFFDFTLDKAPLTHPNIAVIYRRDDKFIECDMEWIFDKAGEYHRTPLEAQMRERYGRLESYGDDWYTPPAPRNRRSILFTIELSSSKDLPIEITGRVSANNRWPLAFKIEPFDFKTARGGQQLKFKSWPAPLPPHAK